MSRELADLDTLRHETVLRELHSAIPDPQRFILVDEMQSGLMDDYPQRALPFRERGVKG